MSSAKASRESSLDQRETPVEVVFVDAPRDSVGALAVLVEVCEVRDKCEEAVVDVNDCGWTTVGCPSVREGTAGEGALGDASGKPSLRRIFDFGL